MNFQLIVVSNDKLHDIATKLSEDVQAINAKGGICRKLGLTEAEIMEMTDANLIYDKKRAYEFFIDMLQRWISRQSVNATPRKLLQTLEDLDLVDASRKKNLQKSIHLFP